MMPSLDPDRSPPPAPDFCADARHCAAQVGSEPPFALARRLGIDRLHAFQREAVEALLRPGGRVLLVAPTGGGKSLCYQLPALCLPGTTLVLSPLVSLMEDQVRSLTAKGIAATFLSSTLSREENGRRLVGLRRGNYKLVYAAPERLGLGSFLDVLAAARVAMVAIDEAHCIVQWGHDFRPDYLRIGEVLERLRPSRAIACTATATPEARQEILDRLGWTDGQTKVILRGFARTNLHLKVCDAQNARDTLRLAQDALRAALGTRGDPCGAGIVYAATRRSTERIAEALRDAGWDAGAYHAGLSADVRASLSAAFAARRTHVVVATNAFGMGIDRADVRIVVHAQLPGSIDAYYQEVGRAGRDGLPATGLLLVSPADIALRRRMCMLGPDGTAADPADCARAVRLLREMLRYTGAVGCRHDFILRYFGDDAESLGGCGHCDACLCPAPLDLQSPAGLARDADVIRRALAGVARARGGAGMQAVASMLAGEATSRVRALKLDTLSTFGVLKGRTTKDVVRILRVLIGQGWVDLTATDYPVPVLTELGWRVVQGKEAAGVRVPDAVPPPQCPPLPPSRQLPLSPPVQQSPLPPLLPPLPEPPAVEAPGPESEPCHASRKVQEEAPPSHPARKPQGEQTAFLFEALRRHRAEVARALGVPAYVVAPNRALTDMAVLRPRSADELRMAHGMGPLRIATHGQGFLEVLRKAMDGPPPSPPVAVTAGEGKGPAYESVPASNLAI